MSHCKDCKFWGPRDMGFVYRPCLLAGSTTALFEAAHFSIIRTHPEFGCVQFAMPPVSEPESGEQRK